MSECTSQQSMISCNSSFPNCSPRCQTLATIRRKVTMSVEASGPLQTKGFRGVECTITLTHSNFRYSSLFRMLLHSFACQPMTYLSFAACVISMFVFDIWQISGGCSQNCSGCAALAGYGPAHNCRLPVPVASFIKFNAANQPTSVKSGGVADKGQVSDKMRNLYFLLVVYYLRRAASLL